jgi:hypothetical protein
VQPDAISPGCSSATVVEGKQQHVGVYFIPPGAGSSR